MEQHYHIDVFWSEEDKCWIANFPDLRYCSAHGDTPEEALAEARIAIGAWTDSMVAAGLSMPEALYRPAKAA